MNWLAKLFGKKPDPDPERRRRRRREPLPPAQSLKQSPEPASTPPAPASPPPPEPSVMMKVRDEYGRATEIPREEWRTKILPHNFQANWRQPDNLAGLIAGALNDGFIQDCLEPARQLQRIDPDPRRGATYLAAVLLQLRRYADAEKVVGDAIRRHGADASLLTNLAKAQNGLGDAALSENTLWRALEADPNLDHSLLWYAAIHRERGGDAAGLAALRRVAALPGTWRPQLWIARAALEARRLDEALGLYRECLARAGNPVPADLLQQISGDLGNAGHLPEILQLVAPHFDAATHGLLVGNNLVKTYVDLGQLDTARQLLDRLYAQKRDDWKDWLNYWDTEIAKARVSLLETPQKLPGMALLTIAGPVWLKPDAPAAELFPAKPTDAPTVALLGSAAEIITNSQRAEYQMTNDPGRMTRALPLYLAERLGFGSEARVQTLVPWIVGEAPAFAFAGAPWQDADAATYARKTEDKSDYVITLYLKPNAEPWQVELRLVRTIDAQCLGTLTGSFPSARPEAGLPALATQLLALLAEQAEIETTTPPAPYQVPEAAWFGSYLLRLEQYLAVRCSAMKGVPTGFLSGEREIVDGNLQLCLAHPHNVGMRILLLQTLLTLKRVHPAIVTEYREKLLRLQSEKPLAEPARSVVQRQVNEVLAE